MRSGGSRDAACIAHTTSRGDGIAVTLHVVIFHRVVGGRHRGVGSLHVWTRRTEGIHKRFRHGLARKRIGYIQATDGHTQRRRTWTRTGSRTNRTVTCSAPIGWVVNLRSPMRDARCDTTCESPKRKASDAPQSTRKSGTDGSAMPHGHNINMLSDCPLAQSLESVALIPHTQNPPCRFPTDAAFDPPPGLVDTPVMISISARRRPALLSCLLTSSLVVRTPRSDSNLDSAVFFYHQLSSVCLVWILQLLKILELRYLGGARVCVRCLV